METKNLTTIDFKNQEQVTFVKRMFCTGATDDEFQLFLHTCKRTGLDPVMKQIYAIKRGAKMTIQTSIDGFRLIADRSGNYSAGREPSYQYSEDGKLLSATAYVKKRTSDGIWHEIAATAYWDEYVVNYSGKVADFWQRMPHLMLAKCAESLVLRKAFPAEMGGIYTDDEMAQAKLDIEEVPVCKEFLTKDQCNEIADLIGADIDLGERILKGYKVNHLTEIESKHYQPIMNKLKARKVS